MLQVLRDEARIEFGRGSESAQATLGLCEKCEKWVLGALKLN